jgi:multiple sugar transport system ATP-binding protein
VRPEHFELSPNKGDIKGTVEYAEILGSDSFLYVTTAYGTLTVREEGKTRFGDGATIYLSPAAGHMHRFGEDGQRLN